WTEDGVSDIGGLDGWAYAYGISGDGSLVLGTTGDGAAYVWEDSGVKRPDYTLTVLGTLGGGSSSAHDCSEDGTVVVGEAEDSSGTARAFRWTAGGGMTDIGGISRGSAAYACSADGSVVVGYRYSTNWDRRAFRW